MKYEDIICKPHDTPIPVLVLINAERMQKRFKKWKQFKVRKFKVRKFKMGDNGSAKFPREDRIKANAKRLPVVVVHIRGSKPKMHKVACAFGMITGYYSASSLLINPVVDIDNEDQEITSRKAC